jgi:hypothetical protein
VNPETLFEQFESRLGTRGVGLGLPISRQLVRRMGGDLKLANIEDAWDGDCLHGDAGVRGTRVSSGCETVMTAEPRRVSTQSANVVEVSPPSTNSVVSCVLSLLPIWHAGLQLATTLYFVLSCGCSGKL